MSASRERDVTGSFVRLASSLVSGYDVVDLLSELTADCAHLLDIASAGLLLADERGVLHVVAASSERTRQLELFQVQRADGPCRDCYLDGAPVSAPDLRTEADRWPQFAPAALRAGFASVHAVPMRLHDQVLGALGLFGTSSGSLDPEDLSLGQALADVASVALVQDKEKSDQRSVNEQLQTALQSRIVLEQAKGVLAQQGALQMDEAFAVLRRYARDHNLRLTAVAEAVVDRRLPAQQLLARSGRS
ncbi:GAF and ANTAR domain-containing protein [Blastococcus sp. VKM Ac-2987]|uniref:GAF and ANTAR domain-containing protein n=1 Tax=Blastococcus sp. VKM Ac-2987 TaxID=3004141 RepID=UPI0022AB9FEF|nr:GAF and ANTAR domain-containing protein [Blastococcus sp. VKM Ac-2987]MCZ2858017.1 GAF and ANTAR domain-containing protein [Blastococcus sp. VKM Ac-2987]